MRTDQAYELIRKRLFALRNAFLRLEFSVLALRLAGWVCGLLLLNVLLTFSPLSAGIQRAIVLLSLAALLLALSSGVWILIRRWPTLTWIAAEAERGTPELEGDLLRGALDLWRRKSNALFGYSLALIEALVRNAFQKSEAIQDRRVIGRRKLRRHLPILPAAAVVVLFLFLLVPGRTAQVVRAIGPVDPDAALHAVGLEVSPGDCSVQAGEEVEVSASFNSYAGKEVLLLVRRGGEGWKTFPMGEKAPATPRLFEARISALQDTAEYLVRFEGGESRPYRIDVTHPPVVTELAYELRFPPYAGLEDRRVEENHGNIRALYGAEVHLEVQASRKIQSAFLEKDDGEAIALVVQGGDCSGRFDVTESFSYVVRVVDGAGNRNIDPVRYEVVPLPDEKPFVRVTYPGEDRTLDQNLNLTIQFAAIDDYGLTAVSLLYRKGEGEEKKVPLFSTKHRVTEVEREREWDLSQERLLPQDVITYYLEVWDNDARNGPKRGVSRTYTLRMPSLAQIYSELEEDQESDIGELEEVYEESRRLEEKLNELSREIQKAEQVSWDEKKKIEGIVATQKEIEKELRNVAGELERTAEELERNRLVTPETLERLAELNRLLQEVATEEMRQAMRELAKAMEQLDPKEIERAAEQLQLTQQDFLERLDRTIDMLKRMKDLQSLDALAEGLRRMAEEQRSLREETQKSDPAGLEELSEEEKALQEELAKLEKEMQQLAEESQERSPGFSQEISEALQKLKEEGTQSKMGEASQQLQKGEKNQALQNQMEAEQNLFDLAFRLAEFQKACNAASQQRAQAAFGEAIQDLLYLSNGQEDILDQSESGGRASLVQRRSFAERQQEVAGGVGRVMEKVREVGREIPELSSRVLDLLRRGKRKAAEAADQYESGDMSLAHVRGDEALQQLNHSVIELLRSQQSYASSCSNPGGQGESMEQMQQMTQRQQCLNQSTSQFPLPSANPGEISTEMRGELSRLAAEQQAIRKGIGELMQEVEGTGEVLGSLDDVVEEMRRVEKDLEKANLSDETRERQEKILSRMLDAQRSIRERGYKRQRRSRVGEETRAASPAELPRSLSEARERIREDLVRMPGFVYPPEYEELIRSYFRALTRED